MTKQDNQTKPLTKITKIVKEIIPIAIILLMIIIGIYVYPTLPDKIPTHWNFKGEIDNYGPKTFALFGLPLIALTIYIILSVIKYFDPYRKNIEEFKHLYGIKLAMVAFMFAIYTGMIMQALGNKFEMGKFVIVLISLLFFYLGYTLRSIKRNYFIGIRTPWTLASETVWNKTHRLGSFLFMLAAFMMLLSFFAPENSAISMIFVLVPIFAIVIFSFGYSFYLFKKEKNSGKKKKEIN
ncbi:MAG: DUF1648 domain-containing protein [Nanoarchaeota archaeon]|nr:DUF1648 domain-containing protein [Nanoarchaeota archaeon]